MNRFRKALVRKPGMNFHAGLTSSQLGVPDYALTLRQHHDYCSALVKCGLDLFILDPNEQYPDSPFVEDTCVLTARSAIITRPGHISRRGEEEEIAAFFRNHRMLRRITEPGTIDGGDVLQVNDRFFIGLSGRSNKEGVRQMEQILKEEGYTADVVELKNYLHLKAAVNYLGDETLIMHEHFEAGTPFNHYNIIRVSDRESYAANCLRINDTILVPEGFPETLEKIKKLNIPVLELQVSEFRKMDGGLTCLSLRF